MEVLGYFAAFVLISIAAKQIGKTFSAIRLPYITGYLFAGMLAGPFVLEMLPKGAAEDLRFVDDLSLAVIAFIAGSELYMKDLQGRLRLITLNTAGIVIAAAILNGIAIFILTDFIPFTDDFSTSRRIAVAILGTTVLLALSPASTIAVIKEVRARGPFTKTILSVTVLMDVVIIILFAVAVAMSDILVNNEAFALSFIVALAIDLMAALVLGYLIGRAIEQVLKMHWPHLVKIALILAFGFLIFEGGSVVDSFSKENLPVEIHIEGLLVSMIAGFYVTNYSSTRSAFEELLHDISPYIYVAFFTLTGVALKLDVLLETLPIAVTLFTIRVFSIFIGSYMAGTITGESKAFKQTSWMAFITQAGIALGLAREVAVSFPTLGNDFATMIVAVVVLNEIVGPMFLKSALRRVNETHLPSDSGQDIKVREATILGIEGLSTALARQLHHHNWKVVIADTDKSHVQRLQDDGLSGRHIECIDLDCMSQLMSNSTDALVALLPDDEENYAACEIAYEHFGIQRLVVRLNDLSIADRFRELGATIIDNGTAMVSLLDQSVRAPQTAAMFMHTNPNHEIIQISITDPSINGKHLRDLRLPVDVLILDIWRNGQTIVPHGYTSLLLHDEVTLIGTPDSLNEATIMLGY